MNKVATYLNEHLQGEVMTAPTVCNQYATDGSVLTIQPDMVVFPRTTNDIRKIARFAWQLAEKGHVLPIVARGAGYDATGGALQKGIVIDLSRHLYAVEELDVKQKLARVQPGITVRALNDGLRFHSLTLPIESSHSSGYTIGGAIATNVRGDYAGKYGATNDYVHQLEVVLASGDVLQTGRMSKKELNKKKGLQTFEGEIYRSIDNLITDNQALIKSLEESMSQAGYPGIMNVREKDGSIDLTPLFISSQGTLGIISEVIMRGEYVNSHKSSFLAIFKSADDARDAIDEALLARPATIEYFGGDLLKQGLLQGKKFEWMSSELLKTGAVLLIEFDDYHERVRQKNAKKLIRKLQSKEFDMHIVEEDEDMIGSLGDIRSVLSLVQSPLEDRVITPSLLVDAMVPVGRFDEYRKELARLSKKHGVALPLYGHALDSLFSVYPSFDFSKVTDRQKMFKLLDEYGDVIAKLGGTLFAGAPEGRLRAPFVKREIGDDLAALYAEVKNIFDPFGFLNPGVKQPDDMKLIVRQLNPRHVPRI